MKPIPNKLKFLFVSIDSLMPDVIWQVVKEGHLAKLYIENEKDRDIGWGFFPIIKEWRSQIDWADVIVFDDVLGQGTMAQELRSRGKYVIGGTPYTDKLEDNRSFGQEQLKEHGISIIPYQNFTSFDQAVDFVKQHPNKYVIKPSGDAQNIKHLLFVGEEEDGSDVIRILEAYKKAWSSKIKEFQLQRKVTGVEIAVGAFFNGQNFLYPINMNFEHKKLLPGNLGPSTGEMGTSMFWDMPNRLFNSTLNKFEETLRRENYVGYFDLNCIVNGNGIYPLEFTCRFGYPAIFIQLEGVLMPVAEFLYRLSKGENFQIKTRKGFQVGVRIVVPPYPFNDLGTFEAYSKDAAITFKKPVLDGIHIEDVKKTNEAWQVAGKVGVALTVVGTGPTMKQAQIQAYNRVKNILIANMYYRTDIGDRWSIDSDKLHSWGYLREK